MMALPTQAASHPNLVEELMRGTDCFRINCAHNAPQIWEAMIANIRGYRLSVVHSTSLK